jgi:hypothetical protein
MAIHRDYLYVYGPPPRRPPPPRRQGAPLAPPTLTAGGAPWAGGESSECEEQVCGDFWVYNLTGPMSCPNECSGHGARRPAPGCRCAAAARRRAALRAGGRAGTCEWGQCICDKGFRDHDCSGLNCPNARCTYSYADHYLDCIECNLRGECFSNGTCACETGWKGESCEELSCPGGCSGHGTCKLGGICECDENFGGVDCFEAFCINNCTVWDNGYDRGTRGDCTILRTPPCCGEEPNCERRDNSPNPCTERNPVYIPAHNVSRTCVCEDTYTGEDCSEDLASNIIADQLAQRSDDESGCFALDAVVVRADGTPVPLAALRAGDEIRTVGAPAPGRAVATARVLFMHEHAAPAALLTLHFRGAGGVAGAVSVTGWHALATAVRCGAGGCAAQHVPARALRAGHNLLLAGPAGALAPARVERVSVREAKVLPIQRLQRRLAAPCRHASRTSHVSRCAHCGRASQGGRAQGGGGRSAAGAGRVNI